MKELYKQALEMWGKKTQILMAVEEFTELNKELLCHLRGRNRTVDIWEEMADAEIMLEQMKGIFGFSKKIKKKKLERLKERLAD